MVKPFLVERNDGDLHLSWNLNANVGLASPNRQDDVELVQLGYIVLGQRKAAILSEELRSLIGKIVVGQPCTGQMNDTLVQTIFAHQRWRKSTVDGHVSVVRDSTGVFGGEAYLLGALINGIWADQTGDFPRVDKHPRCGTALRAAVVRGVAHG